MKTSIATFFRSLLEGLKLRRQTSSQAISNEFLKAKKETLTAKSIEAFLQHVIKGIELREQNTVKFFKFLIISKGFLNVSYNYAMFDLVLKKYSKNYMNVYFHYDSKSCYASQLSISQVRNFIRLLNPKRLYINFDRMSYKMMNEVREIMRSCLGKFLVQIYDVKGKYDEYFLSILNEFANRLRRLMCKPDLLTKTIVPKLKLEGYHTGELSLTMNQAEFFLRTLKANELRLYVHDVNETAMTDLSSQNCAIKNLYLKFFDCSMDVLEDLLSSLLKMCPKLQKLNLVVGFSSGSHEEEFDPGSTVEKTLSSRKWYNQLKLKFSHLSYFQLYLFNTIHCDRSQYDSVWMNELRTYAEFNGAKDRIFSKYGLIFNEIELVEENKHGHFYTTVCHDESDDED